MQTQKVVVKNVVEYKSLGITLTVDWRDDEDIPNMIKRGNIVIR